MKNLLKSKRFWAAATLTAATLAVIFVQKPKVVLEASVED